MKVFEVSSKKIDEVLCSLGWDSIVSIATCYRLNGPGIESHWGVRFSAPVQASPGAHPVSYTSTGSFSRAGA